MDATYSQLFSAFRQVPKFKDLGSILAEPKKSDIGVRTRIALAKAPLPKAEYGHGNGRKSLEKKETFYILLYGSE